MANPSTAHEPSMEEILASIRQIISEDGEGAAGDRTEARSSDPAEADAGPDMELAPASPAPTPESSENAPDKGGSMKPQISESPAKTAAKPEASAPLSPALGASQQRPEAPRSFEPPPAVNPVRAPFPAPVSAPAQDRNLLSHNSDTQVSGAFNALAHTILAQNARTLEDLVSEMLRPMLKSWLDANLPPLVERLVKEEIERVSRGRR